MSNQPKISFLFRSTFLPTGATYIGVHDTTDISYGTEQYSDPYIGNGAKLIALSKQYGNQRRLWNVSLIQVGTRQQVDQRLKSMLETLNYDDSRCLNSIEGWPTGRKQTPEHNAKRAAAQGEAMKGNEHALGRKDAHIDVDLPAGQKLKWLHSPDGREQKMLLVDGNDRPIKPAYNDWILGKKQPNAYVTTRLDTVREEKNAPEIPSEDKA